MLELILKNSDIKLNVAVIITCYNRSEKTLESLAAIYTQSLTGNINLQVYLMDDGSTDDTESSVRQAYPQVKLLRGSGRLFWNGGMRVAFFEALRAAYDYYLWLNDDTLLEFNTLSKLLNTHHYLVEQGHPNSIVVGSTRDRVTGKLTYGGVVRSSYWRRLHFNLVEPDEKPTECETMNGNCVLIPLEVAKKVGNLDEAFTHGMGDYDYGLRARKLGCSVWVAPGYIGLCPRNSQQKNWTDSELSLRERLSKISHPKGLPLSDWKVFARRHGGLFWPIYWLSPYVKLILSSVFGSLRKNYT